MHTKSRNNYAKRGFIINLVKIKKISLLLFFSKNNTTKKSGQNQKVVKRNFLKRNNALRIVRLKINILFCLFKANFLNKSQVCTTLRLISRSPQIFCLQIQHGFYSSQKHLSSPSFVYIKTNAWRFEIMDQLSLPSENT